MMTTVPANWPSLEQDDAVIGVAHPARLVARQEAVPTTGVLRTDIWGARAFSDCGIAVIYAAIWDVNGQVVVPAGGQLKVPTPRG